MDVCAPDQMGLCACPFVRAHANLCVDTCIFVCVCVCVCARARVHVRAIVEQMKSVRV